MPNRLRVLLVEDNPDDAKMALRELKRAGFEVISQRVDTEAAFLDSLAGKLDFILSDYSMPEFDGMRALELLNKSGLEIPFIILSGSIGEDIAVEAIKKGAADYLMKDRVARLGNAVKHALAEKHLRQRGLQAEQELRQAHESLRLILAQSPAVIYNLRIEGQKVVPEYVSENVERLLGFTAAETMSQEWWLQCLHPEDRDRAQTTLAQAPTQGGYSMEYRIRHKDGTYRWVEDTNRVSRGPDGKPNYLIGVWTDISEHKNSEQVLRNSSRQETGRKKARILKELGAIFAVGALCLGVLAYTDVLQAPIQKLFIEYKDNLDDVFGAVTVLLLGFFVFAYRRWKEAQGQIGEQAIIEEALRTLQGELEKRIQLRTADLTVTNDALRREIIEREKVEAQRQKLEKQFLQAQKMEGIGQLAGGVAHDFNNLLAVIGGNLELFLMTAQNLDAQGREYLSDAAQAADRAAILTRQLLTFSRSAAVEMQFLNLNDLTASFTKMLRRVVGEHIRVQTDLAPTPPPIKADPGMIEQVLMNLAVNARDAMPNGGSLIIGTEIVEISKDRAKLEPRVRPGHFACLSVRDTGTGIAPENMSRIFEPFFTTKGVGKGTGLGLATVFGIAEQHQGWVDVSSEVGVGTTFRVFLPLSDEAIAAPNLAVGQKISGGTEKVLVVEDEKGVRNVVVQTLENHGYEVVEADTAVSAQKIWADHGGQFDLIITDMVMPGGLNGLELIDLLRAQKPGLKALLTSGYSADLARGDLARAKGITFLHKPFSTWVLAESVRKCLDRV